MLNFSDFIKTKRYPEGFRITDYRKQLIILDSQKKYRQFKQCKQHGSIFFMIFTILCEKQPILINKKYQNPVVVHNFQPNKDIIAVLFKMNKIKYLCTFHIRIYRQKCIPFFSMKIKNNNSCNTIFSDVHVHTVLASHGGYVFSLE